MQINISPIVSFCLGATVVNVPTDALTSTASDELTGLVFFAVKSIIGGLISVAVARAVNRSKQSNNSQTPKQDQQ